MLIWRHTLPACLPFKLKWALLSSLFVCSEYREAQYMYFAHFTVCAVSAPLLCNSVFASCCGKHNTAMIAHAFQRAQNTAEEPKHSPFLPLPFNRGIQLPWLQTCIMTASPGGQRRYPTDAETLYPVVTSAVQAGAWWALARHYQKLGWHFLFIFFLC